MAEMIKLKDILLEVILPSKSEFEKAIKDSKYSIIELSLKNDGTVRIDDMEAFSKETIARLQLDFNDKKVRAYHRYIHGNKIDPRIQQLVSSLLKKHIIDHSWKMKFGDYESYYLGGKYVYKFSDYENLPVNFWSRNKRINLGENLILYHGTSELELPAIKTEGLKPLGYEGTKSGGESRWRNEYNKDFVYLSGTLQNAYRYADLKARWNMRETNKKEYEWIEHKNWEYWFIKPVVLSIEIPDFSKLRSDDDRVLDIFKQKAIEIWDKLNPNTKKNQQEKSIKWFKDRGVNYERLEEIGWYNWLISDNGLEIIAKLINPSEWNNWKESLKSHNQVAYKGIIPPKFIKIINLYNISDKK